MGNLDSLRDWGHAKEYVEMQWLMLQAEKPKDYVIASGSQSSVRDFILIAAKNLGIEIDFNGQNEEEVGTVKSIKGNMAPAINVGDEIIKIDPRYYRPAEVETLLGDSSQAQIDLGWKPKISLEEMTKEMIEEDLKHAKNLSLINNL